MGFQLFKKGVFLFPCVLVACTTVLGIDGNYTPISDAPPSAGGRAGAVDAAASGGSPSQKPANASGGATGNGGYPNGLPPPPFEAAGGTTTGSHMDPDAGQKCPIGQKWCGRCVPKDPSFGCATAQCTQCMVTDKNAHAICDEIGTCDIACNDGFLRNVDHCERPKDAGAGGTPGAGGAMGDGGKGTGGAVGSGGATGSGGRNSVCNPLACPTCSRGFEGCCIPAVPGMPSHCGCFYFPPLCTKDVG